MYLYTYDFGEILFRFSYFWKCVYDELMTLYGKYKVFPQMNQQHHTMPGYTIKSKWNKENDTIFVETHRYNIV